MKGLSDLKVWQLAAIAYGLLYFLLVGLMEADNITRSYTVAYVAWSMITQVLVAIGVVIFATDRAPHYTKLWSWLFPMMVAEVGVGLYFDVTIGATDTPIDHVWIFNLLIGLWLMVPAYYFNLCVARARME